MRVLILNYEYPPLGGGAGNATYYLLREFQDREDLSIELVASSAGPDRVESLGRNIRIHLLDIGKRGTLHLQSNRDLMTYSLAAWRYGRRLIRSTPFDVCHAFLGIPCGFIARQFGIPYIISLRGSDVPFYNPRFDRLDRMVFKRLSPRIWRGAEAVVANSQGLRGLALESAPNQDISVIPNGVDIGEFRPGRESGGGPLRVLCVSRLIERKGIGYLIQAMTRLEPEAARLTIIGEGGAEMELRALTKRLNLEDRVSFAGRAAHDDMPAHYQAHDVFVLPSLNEGMSNTALEALASGLPLLMTPTGGAEELLADNCNGFSIPPQSVDAIAEKLCFYADHPEIRRQHAREARRTAETMSWTVAADAYWSIYAKAAKNPESRGASK